MHRTQTVRRSSCALVLLLAIVVLPISVAAAPQGNSGQSNSGRNSDDISRFSRIEKWSDVAAGYVGCFRVPSANGVLNYSGYGLIMSGPNAMFLTKESQTSGGFVAAEIEIPADIHPSPATTGCALASLLQAPSEIWEGKFTQLSDPSVTLQANQVNLWGLLA